MSEGYKRPIVETVAGKILDQKLKDVWQALESDLQDLCQELALAKHDCRSLPKTLHVVVRDPIAD
jgi:hypothetical protein